MNKLKGMACYLAGPIDRVQGDGVEWRKRVTPQLQDFGVLVLDPCHKPSEKGGEIGAEKEKTHALRASGNWEALRDTMQEIVRIDLRMVDKSDFILAHVPSDTHMCGTWHEIAIACSQKKPVLLVCPQGLKDIPLWQFGVNHYDFMFENFDDAIAYLKTVDLGEMKEVHKKRWQYFNFGATK